MNEPNNPTFWQWLANGLLGIFFIMTTWLSKRQITRVDDIEKRVNELSRDSVSRKELDHHLDKFDAKMDRLESIMQTGFEKMERKISGG